MLSKTKPTEKCRFGSNCWRKFCKFDHSFVYHKVNNHDATSKYSCCKCGETFKAKNNLATHLINHEVLQIEKEPAEPIDENFENEHENSKFNDREKSLSNKSTDESSDDQISSEGSKTGSESGEISSSSTSSSENPSISSGGNVIDQLSDQYQVVIMSINVFVIL